MKNVYYIYTQKEKDGDWDIEGCYSKLPDAESCKLSFLLSNKYYAVEIIEGPMIITMEN